MSANPYIDKEIHHENVLDRIMEMIHMSAGYVVLPGGTGTLSEFGLVWEYVSKGLIGPRPIFVVGDFWRPMVQRMIADRPRSGRCVHLVDTAHQIVEIALRTVGPVPAS
jgi:predicted Rossmann-fold nucleotide-binding protein